jgi:hypothetical protein
VKQGDEQGLSRGMTSLVGMVLLVLDVSGNRCVPGPLRHSWMDSLMSLGYLNIPGSGLPETRSQSL